MQTNQTTALRPTDKGYVTIVKQACNKVTGFRELYKEMERSISISGKSRSTLVNYSRQLAHLALHYDCFPLDLDSEQVMDYLYLVKSQGTTSATFFKFTVYGMRPAYEVAGVLNAHWNTVSGSGYSSWQMRTLDALRRCRTSSLGAHVDGCISCGHIRISYNSCRNRHCPPDGYREGRAMKEKSG